MSTNYPPGVTETILNRHFGAPHCEQCGREIPDEDEDVNLDHPRCQECREAQPELSEETELPPPEIIAAPTKVTRWMREHHPDGWALGGLCDRRFAGSESDRRNDTCVREAGPDATEKQKQG